MKLSDIKKTNKKMLSSMVEVCMMYLFMDWC